jgi:pyruvate/2-oxoglutarate/acetoin dehydrogenase E1 component
MFLIFFCFSFFLLKKQKRIIQHTIILIVERVTGADVPMPYAQNLEVSAVPSVDDIVFAAAKACNTEL